MLSDPELQRVWLSKNDEKKAFEAAFERHKKAGVFKGLEELHKIWGQQNRVEECACKNKNRFGNAKRHYMPHRLSHAGVMSFFLFVDPLDQRTRVMSCTQLVSQVLPSSGESACSQ